MPHLYCTSTTAWLLLCDTKVLLVYITLSNIENGGYITLNLIFDNRKEVYEISLA